MRWYHKTLAVVFSLAVVALYGSVFWYSITRLDSQYGPLVIKDKGVTESGRRIWVLEDSKTGKEYIVGDKK